MPQHGTTYTYKKHGCRCDACRSANTAMAAAYMARRRANSGLPLRSPNLLHDSGRMGARQRWGPQKFVRVYVEGLRDDQIIAVERYAQRLREENQGDPIILTATRQGELIT